MAIYDRLKGGERGAGGRSPSDLRGRLGMGRRMISCPQRGGRHRRAARAEGWRRAPTGMDGWGRECSEVQPGLSLRVLRIYILRFSSVLPIAGCYFSVRRRNLQGSKKRGSAVLEDGGYSSGGPIRRLRPRSSSMMNDKACQTMKSWDFPGPQDLEEAGSGCNPENDLNHGFSWKGTEQSQTTIPTASIASSAFGDDKFVSMTSLPCPAFDAPSRAPLEPARERVVFACTILDLLYSVLQWPTRAELIAQYPHQVDYDRSRERAVQQLLMAPGEYGNFINLVIDPFVFVVLDLVESGPFDYVPYGLEDLLGTILSTPGGEAYVRSLSTSHQIRLGLIFFRSAWRRTSDL